MRLFLIGWAENRPELVQTAGALRRAGHDIQYWVRDTAIFPLDESLFPGTVFHSLADAVAARPAPGIDPETVRPPGEALLGRLYRAESIFLTMMNKKFDWLTVDERKHLYYRYVGYWQAMLERFRPELIVFSFIPHTLYNFVLYELAKLMNIPTLMVDTTLIGDRILLTERFEEGNQLLEETFLGQSDLSGDNLSPDLRDYAAKQTADIPPSYMDMEYNKYSFGKVAKMKLRMVLASIKDRTFFKKVFRYGEKFFQSDLRDEYAAVSREPDWEKKFVYVPLQYQPECTTSPMGGLFVDQILMIEILSAALPAGWELYVKEHPIQWLSRGANFVGARYRGYYDAIARIKGVRVVPLATDSFTLTRHSRAVATATGTAAWEAVLRGRPAIIFGYPWFQHCPGISRADSVESAAAALARIARGETVDPAAVRRFLRAFDRASFHGFVDEYGKDTSPATPEENGRNFTSALLSAVSRIQTG